MMMNEIMGGQADELLRAKTKQQAGGRVHEADDALGIDPEDAFGARFQDEARLLLAGFDLVKQRAGGQVALQDLQGHRHDRHQFLKQGLLLRVKNAEGGHLDYTEERILGQQGHGHGLDRRGGTQPGNDPEIIGRQAVQHDGLALLCALADEAFARTELHGRTRRIGQPVGGEPPESSGACLEKIEARDTPAEQGHETGYEPLPEFGQRDRALQLSGELGGVGLDPTLLVHRRSALLEGVDGSGQAAGFVRGPGKWNILRVITPGNAPDRSLKRLDRLDDAPDRQGAQNAAEQKDRTFNDQDVPLGLPDRINAGLARVGRDVFIVLEPLVQRFTGRPGNRYR